MSNPRDYPEVIRSEESGRPLRRGVKMLTINVDGQPFTYGQPGWWASIDDPKDNDVNSPMRITSFVLLRGVRPEGDRRLSDFSCRCRADPRDRSKEFSRSHLPVNLQFAAFANVNEYDPARDFLLPYGAAHYVALSSIPTDGAVGNST